MQGDLVFAEQKYAKRLEALQAKMAEQGLEICLISTPENIYYLTGLDHWGYFVPHVLIVSLERELTLVTRDMERVTVTNQVKNAWFATVRAIGEALGKMLEARTRLCFSFVLA